MLPKRHASQEPGMKNDAVPQRSTDPAVNLPLARRARDAANTQNATRFRISQPRSNTR
jgi:hypothetical protein